MKEMIKITDKEKALLSKHKHIYCINGANGTLMAQKFPVVSINKSYTYFRVNGSDELARVETRHVENDLSDKRTLVRLLDRYSWHYIWELPDDFSERNQEYMKMAQEALAKEYRRNIWREYQKAKRNFEFAEKKYLQIADDLQEDEKV